MIRLFIKTPQHKFEIFVEQKDNALIFFNLPVYPYADLRKNVLNMLKSIGSVSKVVFRSKSEVYDMLSKEPSNISTGTKCMRGSVSCEFDGSYNLESGMEFKWSSYSNALVRHKKAYISSRPEIQALKEELERKMREHEEEVAKKNAATLKRMNEADEEGWIMVSRVGKKNKSSDGNVVVKAAVASRDVQAKNYSKENFYSFQKKESKRQRLLAAKERIEQQKRKLEWMRTKRNFKP